MITFLDENDVEYGALATIKATNAVNGERSLTGTIVSGDYVLSNIERGWRLRFDDEYFVVTYAKPIDEGRDVQVEFDAVHQFFWDFDKSSVYDQLADGSHTFVAYLDFIFKNSGYSYTVDTALNVHAFKKESFGLKKRLTLFNDIITSTGVEFQVNGKVVRILEKVGTDLSTIVRKNFNMNELTIEKNIGDFVTYQKGFGAYFDEEDHTKGRLVTEYTSPLASVYGKLEAEPLVDERYTQADNMIAALKANVDNSYTISVALDMEDLTRAGYKYKQPVAGDYIMAINETLDFQDKIRIVSFTSEYDVQGNLVKHEVTCNDIGTVKKLSASYNLTKKQASSASATASNAYSIANKALVSADGKNTNYYTNSFPIDNPKGTLKTGDLLFLTVGDTVKQYYWNGADWVINPVIDDVEAFKEQIADELKDVPNREEFVNKISEELANSKAEIETQIDTAKSQAESNAKSYADEINQATAEVAEQANTAADALKTDLAKVKTDLTATTSTANSAKTSASEAKQQITTVANNLSNAKTDLQNAVGEVANNLSNAKTDLQNAVSEVNTKATNLQSDLAEAKQDLQTQANQLTAQASAQSELTKRMSTVEETANGTKTTVSELSKTVAQNGNDITSVTNRTKTVEDDLAGTKTTLSQVQATANSTSQKAATLETGLNGLSARFESLKVGAVNLLKNSKGPFQPNKDNPNKYDNWIVYPKSTAYLEEGKQYIVSAKTDGVFSNNHVNVESDNIVLWMTKPNGTVNKIISDAKTGEEGTVFVWDYPTGEYCLRVNAYHNDPDKSVWDVQIEKGNVATDYSPSEADLELKVAEYRQNADQNYASLQSTVQALDGTVTANKATADQTAAGFSTRIESLETYKDGETTRANQYFESAKTETARQLTAERTAIAKDYVAKSTYTSDVTGIRNDLTATTTTANTTKTNLANYQASNDRAVANLQTNLQTANGNISSLQTKVEAVPGQITSAVSAVEGKIPTEINTRNLWIQSKATGGFVEEILPDNHITDQKVCYRINSGKEMRFIIEPNFSSRLYQKVTFSAWIKYDDVVQGTNAWNKFNVFKHNFTYRNSETEASSGTDFLTLARYTGTSDWQYVHFTHDYTNSNYDQLKGSLVFNLEGTKSGTAWVTGVMVQFGDVLTGYVPAIEDTANQISTLSSQIQQTADGMTLLATKTELNTAKTELQSGITTATSKAETAQSTANSNAQTISTHTTQISALNTGLSAKVSQSDFNTLSGRVTNAENNITAKANELSSKITSVEGKIPTSIGGRNLWIQSKATGNFVEETLPDNHVTGQKKCYRIPNNGQLAFNIEPDFSSRLYQKVTFSAWVKYENVVQGTDSWNKFNVFKHEMVRRNSLNDNTSGTDYTTLGSFTGTSDWKYITYTYDYAANKSYDQLKTSIKFNLEGAKSGTAWVTGVKIELGSIPSDYSPAPEDTESDINTVSSELKQTKDGMTLLATKTELNTAKSDLQSGISTATTKADNAQATANNNAQTISTHTTQISALNTGLSAKVSQSDFNTLSGRVTTAENNITAKANELSSKITSVEGKIPKSASQRNLVQGTSDVWSPFVNITTNNNWCYGLATVNYGDKTGIYAGTTINLFVYLSADEIVLDSSINSRFYIQGMVIDKNGNPTWTNWNKYHPFYNKWSTNLVSGNNYRIVKLSTKVTNESYSNINGFEIGIRIDGVRSGKFHHRALMVTTGDVFPDSWSPAPEDYDSKLATAQSEIKQTTDAIKASVSSLDSSTVKTASLTINTDGVVMKAGKSTTDVANAIGSYFSVNQNAINLFSDKINVKGNMIVSGAITSDKIASKSINTAHLNGKIITADVIATGAITADAIKAGAITTDKMSANSINGDRITAGTLDAAKIKAGSITASQIASGTITSAQIKTGTISAANIAAGAITTDKIAANSINSDKIAASGITANVIKGGKLQSLTNTTNFDLDTGKLFYNNNNTGVFRVEDGASTMGLKFSNTPITVNGTSRILSRVILGGDRRETSLDDGKWDQGGFTGIVAETINGVASDEHGQADTLRVIGDNVYFTHSYNNDVITNAPAQGWKMENYSPFSSYAGDVVLKPYGINYRNSSIIAGDFRLDNGDGSGYWVRGCIGILRNCFHHFLNGGTSSDVMNAIRNDLKKISGV